MDQKNILEMKTQKAFKKKKNEETIQIHFYWIRVLETMLIYLKQFTQEVVLSVQKFIYLMKVIPSSFLSQNILK